MYVNVDYIEDLIDSRGYTLGQVAIKSGLSKAQWSRILSGKRGIGMKSIEGILRAFPEANMDQIFLDEVLLKGNREKEAK